MTIRNLTVEKFASHAQTAALVANAAGWIVKNVDIEYSHGAGVDIFGSNGQIRNSYIHDNGETGVVVYKNTGTVVDSNELSHNNTDGFLINDGENGGLKTTQSGLTISNNYVHDNIGLGLWMDIDDNNVIVNDNYISNNDSDGIRFEISYNGQIYNNTLVNNGVNRGRVGCSVIACGASITVNTSGPVDIHDNIVYKGDRGIGLIESNRGSGTLGLRDLTNVTVHNNTITMLSGTTGLTQSVSNNAYFTGKGNSFSNNHYHLASTAGSWFNWLNTTMTIASWQSNGNDTAASGGSFDTLIPGTPAPPTLSVGPQ